MDYQTVVDMALNAYSLKECLAAEAAITRWLFLHPEDLGLHEIAGQLGIVKAAAMECEATDPAYSVPAPRLKAAVH